MTPDNFKSSLAGKAPPAGLSPALCALWWAGNDNWDKVHRIVMDENATHGLASEWNEIVAALLEDRRA